MEECLLVGRLLISSHKKGSVSVVGAGSKTRRPRTESMTVVVVVVVMTDYVLLRVCTERY